MADTSKRGIIMNRSKSLLVIFVANVFFCSAYAADLHLKVLNAVPGDGNVYLALYDSEEAYDDQAGFVDAVKASASGENVEVVFSDLNPGQYAVTVFQDVNGNEELDTGWFGKPEEPFGFSRDAVANMGPPSFENAAIKIDAEDVNGIVTLQK